MDKQSMNYSKGPNQPLYFTVALIVIFLSVIGSVMWVSARTTNDVGTILAGIFAFASPTIAAVLALLASVRAADAAAKTENRVNGTLDNLVTRAVDAEVAAGIINNGGVNTPPTR